MNKLPLVSIVITTKNEEKNIGNCLESMKVQTYSQEKIEIIVVDNNSTDTTKEIAKNIPRRFIILARNVRPRETLALKKQKESMSCIWIRIKRCLTYHLLA